MFWCDAFSRSSCSTVFASARHGPLEIREAPPARVKALANEEGCRADGGTSLLRVRRATTDRNSITSQGHTGCGKRANSSLLLYTLQHVPQLFFASVSRRLPTNPPTHPYVHRYPLACPSVVVTSRVERSWRGKMWRPWRGAGRTLCGR